MYKPFHLFLYFSYVIQSLTKEEKGQFSKFRMKRVLGFVLFYGWYSLCSFSSGNI